MAQMSLSFWLASIGILLSFLGTLLLVFCIPVFARFDYSGNSMSVLTPDKGESDFRFAWNLFKSALKKKDRTLIIAIASLSLGTMFQIVALIDC